jgi:hypothetical protein
VKEENTMDSTKQMNEMVNTYAQAQQRLWENWFGLVQGSQPGSPNADFWGAFSGRPWPGSDDQVRDFMETQVKNILAIQLTWVQHGLNAVGPCTQHLSTILDGCTRQLQQVSQSNGEVNKQVVESCIEISKQLNIMDVWNETFQRLAKSWGEAVQKTAELQPPMPKIEPTEDTKAAASSGREKSAAGGKAS